MYNDMTIVAVYPDRDDMLSSAISYAEINPMLSDIKVFVPTKRKYYTESLYSHYAHTHDATPLDYLRDQKSKYPDDLPAFGKVMKGKRGYMLNRMIMQKDLMDHYCTRVFDLLFSLYDHADRSEMSAFDKRFCGRVSKFLFDGCFEYELENGILENKDVKELRIMEDVKLRKKVISFLSAKFLGKEYQASAFVKNDREICHKVIISVFPAGENICSGWREAYYEKAVA